MEVLPGNHHCPRWQRTPSTSAAGGKNRGCFSPRFFTDLAIGIAATLA